MDEARELLEAVHQRTVRPYSNYDFGRSRDETACSVTVSERAARELLPRIRSRLEPGMLAYIGTTQWLGDEQPDGVEVAIGQGNSQFDILRQARSDAANYDMTTEDLITKLQDYDTQYGIDIFHAETDTIEFRLLRVPEDMDAFARDLYEFCPDIVDQGVGSLEALKASILQNQQVYLWWD